ncbi:unnamed protein product [Rangifer tarandus platyrhynchus]|uniref:Uncharacterized protein n=1 Tax=Rangifer tarandus platyrhynchus TaxID=3082113 RepID=A0ABN9A0I7_RANTA|nr:unnamed protein product [Rangifer tarandus platyrhynchus]
MFILHSAPEAAPLSEGLQSPGLGSQRQDAIWRVSPCLPPRAWRAQFLAQRPWLGSPAHGERSSGARAQGWPAPSAPGPWCRAGACPFGAAGGGHLGWGRAAGAAPGHGAWGKDAVDGNLASEGSQAHAWGGKAFHAGTVPGGLGAGTRPEGPEARGQETLWVPGTPCSAAGGSDVALRPGALLAERGPWVGGLWPLLGLCRRLLGWPTLALARSAAWVFLRMGSSVQAQQWQGCGDGAWEEAVQRPQKAFPRPPTVRCWVPPGPVSSWVTGRLGAGRTLEPIVSTLRSPRLTFVWPLRFLEMDCVQEAMHYS